MKIIWIPFKELYVLQVLVESKIETNSISFILENTVHGNIYAVVNFV